MNTTRVSDSDSPVVKKLLDDRLWNKTRGDPTFGEEKERKISDDLIFYGDEYAERGDRLITSPPLIDTSLFELSHHGWILRVSKRVLPSLSGTKLKFQFRAPTHPNPVRQIKTCLTFRKWIPRLIWDRDEILSVLLSSDLEPNFSRPPSFMLKPEDQPVVQVHNTEVKIHVEDELSALQRINKERLARIGSSLVPVIENDPMEQLKPIEVEIPKVSADILDINEYLPKRKTA